MGGKKTKIGWGELLFILVILLGIIGTISFFAFEDFFGQYQTTFIIASSLAFIAAFFALSVYARAKKRAHVRRLKLDRALSNWAAYNASPHAPLPPRTLESLAYHALTGAGCRPAPIPAAADGIIRLLDQDDRPGLLMAHPGPRPLSLRDLVSFYGILRQEKAAWGEIWSLSGYEPDAVQWVNRKPLTLLDAEAIRQIVDELAARDGSAASGASQ